MNCLNMHMQLLFYFQRKHSNVFTDCNHGSPITLLLPKHIFFNHSNI